MCFYNICITVIRGHLVISVCLFPISLLLALFSPSLLFVIPSPVSAIPVLLSLFPTLVLYIPCSPLLSSPICCLCFANPSLPFLSLVIAIPVVPFSYPLLFFSLIAYLFYLSPSLSNTISCLYYPNLSLSCPSPRLGDKWSMSRLCLSILFFSFSSLFIFRRCYPSPPFLSHLLSQSSSLLPSLVVAFLVSPVPPIIFAIPVFLFHIPSPVFSILVILFHIPSPVFSIQVILIFPLSRLCHANPTFSYLFSWVCYPSPSMSYLSFVVALLVLPFPVPFAIPVLLSYPILPTLSSFVLIFFLYILCLILSLHFQNPCT